MSESPFTPFPAAAPDPRDAAEAWPPPLGGHPGAAVPAPASASDDVDAPWEPEDYIPGLDGPAPLPSGSRGPYLPPVAPVAPVAAEAVGPVVPAPAAAPAAPVALAPQAVAAPTVPAPRESATADKRGKAELDRLLVGLVSADGSDLHLVPDEVARYRLGNKVLPAAFESPLTTEAIEGMLEDALRPEAWAEYAQFGDLDTAYALDQKWGDAITCRFRTNVARTMGKTAVTMRVIPTRIKTLDEIGAPPVIKTLLNRRQGIIIFTGPTGSGKSTSMAAAVDEINESQDKRIWTIEDPVEFTHSSKRSTITHREVGTDTPSFEEGLRRVRREDPDIILIGEMRDYITMQAAIEAADSGHLVFATLHTNSAPETINRIINSFPANQQEQVRATLADSLLAVIAQTLVDKKGTGSGDGSAGRVLAAEVMIVNSAIRAAIRTGETAAIVAALMDQSGGNQTMEADLARLFRQGVITRKAAEVAARDPKRLRALLDDRS